MNCVVVIWHPGRLSGGHPEQCQRIQYAGPIVQDKLDHFMEQQLRAWCSSHSQMPLSFATVGHGMMATVKHAFWMAQWHNGSQTDSATVEMFWI